MRPAFPAWSGRKAWRARRWPPIRIIAFGQVWLAVALGYQARIIGAVKARMANIAGPIAQRRWTQAVQDDPRQCLCGVGAGRLAYRDRARRRRLPGAAVPMARSESEALALFDRAVRLAPGNVAVRYQIALSLAGFNAEKYQARIATEFKAALPATPETAYEKKIRGRAAELSG